MNFYFFDTSALVKRYHAEDGSERVDEIFGSGDAVIVISNLSITETISAFKRKQNEGKLDEGDMGFFTSKFFYDVVRDFLVLDLTGKHVRESVRLVLEGDLRTLDALQLAISMDLRGRESVFVSSDRKLCGAAEKEGMSILCI